MSENCCSKEQAEQIIRRYADTIYKTAYQHLKNHTDADDIFQEVCVAIITKNTPISDEEHLKRWLIRVTINKCRDFKKSVWQKRTDSFDDHTELTAPETSLVMEELKKIPDSYADVLYLYYYEDYTISEIAEILGTNPNTIGSRLRRARKKLKKLLEEGDSL